MSESSLSQTQNSLAQLESTGQLVRRSVIKQDMFRFFERFTPWFAIGMVPVLLALRLVGGFSRLDAILVGVVLTAVWFGTWALIAFSRNRNLLNTFLKWDQSRKQKGEIFSSAWAFETTARRENRELAIGEQLHVSRAIQQIPAAKTLLPTVFQAPTLAKTGVAVAIMLLAAITMLPKAAIDQGEELLSDEMKAEAAAQSAALKKQIAGLDKLAEDGVIEKEDLEKLKQDLEEGTDSLADTDGMTANEVLESIEARARALEKRAGDLEDADNVWASEEMLREMSQHADFADLSVTIKDKNAEAAWAEAVALTAVLDKSEIKLETADRITTALERTMAAATEKDEKKRVGEHFGNASRKMQDNQPRTAAREFLNLSLYFKMLQRKEESRKKLEDLAEKMREAGSKIAGSKLEKMKQLAGNKGGENGKGADGKGAPKGLESIAQAPMPMPNQPMPQMPQAGQQGGPQNIPGVQKMPVPGSGNQQQPGGKGQKGMMAPIPGQGDKSGDKGDGQKGMAMANGKAGDKGKGGKGLMAPVPGQGPGGPPQGAMAGQNGGANGGSPSNQAGTGGLEAGQGTAEMGNTPTEATAAGKESTVVAQINKDGESEFRAVEGGAHSEKAELSTQEAVVNFIAVEEQALDGKSLPMSRKEHVLRYFTEIRRQFEKAESTN